ncbi:hypothetical protein L3i22_010900 [Actinoplanes sp. L3-i22]|nr:hypothetical protein L3i22_010900 [Actinoplanes sp. L3-i22]
MRTPAGLARTTMAGTVASHRAAQIATGAGSCSSISASMFMGSSVSARLRIPLAGHVHATPEQPASGRTQGFQAAVRGGAREPAAPAERCANRTRVRSVTGVPETGVTSGAISSGPAARAGAAKEAAGPETAAADGADALETAAVERAGTPETAEAPAGTDAVEIAYAVAIEALCAAGTKPAGLAGAAMKARSRARSAGNDRNTEVRCAVVVMAVKVTGRSGRPRDAPRRAATFTRR